ncbi:MAG: N-acetylornithine carbamoyltransferase [Saprospiraceae bacterium]
MRQFLSVKDVNDVDALVKRALEIKAKKASGSASTNNNYSKGKTIVLLFFNPSLRTRLSTEKAAQNLGMKVITMNAGQGWQLEFEDGAIMNLDKAEHVKEAAGVISQYADLIGIRTFPSLTDRDRDYGEFVLKQFVKYASVPVISLESATLHPLQSLTDLLTIYEHKKTDRPKVVLTWAPHPRALPQAVANSFVEWMNTAEVELVVTHPIGAELAPQFVENVQVEYDQERAFAGADFIYAKNWSSYFEYGKIISPTKNWMVTADKMALTNQAKFMHCLPVRRNVVVSDEVIDSSNSVVIGQAGNREFAAQAVLEQLLNFSHA